jgi:hypothetical protein
MSHHRLGETTQARADYALATRLAQTQRALARDMATLRARGQSALSDDDLEELDEFAAEAVEVFRPESAPPPREKK